MGMSGGGPAPDDSERLRQALAAGGYPSFETVDAFNGAVPCEWTRMTPAQRRAEYERGRAEWERARGR